MPGSPVAVRAGASLLSRRLPSRVRQQSALCGQLTFRLAWYREHSVVMATEHLQPRGNSLPVQLRNPDITYGLFRRQLKGHLFWEA